MDEDQSMAKPSYSWADTSGMQVSVRYPEVQWRLYALNEDQLANLEKGSDSVSLGLLGLFGGIAFSALTTILTVELPDRPLHGSSDSSQRQRGLAYGSRTKRGETESQCETSWLVFGNNILISSQQENGKRCTHARTSAAPTSGRRRSCSRVCLTG